MLKTLLFVFYLLFSYSVYSQDSTEIPNIIPRNLRPGITYTLPYNVYNNVKDLPEFLQKAIDSVNLSPVVLKMYNDSIVSDRIKIRCEREFRRVTVTNENVWLLTYTHRIPSVHEHFVVFKTKGNTVIKMTAGISEVVIDSVETINRLKADRKIKFINLRSKIETHKF